MQRTAAVSVLLVTGFLSVPAVAFVLDDWAGEGWVIPVQLVVMTAIGAGLGLALPGMARRGAPLGPRVVTGACWGLLAGLAGVLVFMIVLGGR
ncbi:hypothetical protein GCM10023339_46500 [Alloalcanivorax gelatiniphagus]